MHRGDWTVTPSLPSLPMPNLGVGYNSGDHILLDMLNLAEGETPEVKQTSRFRFDWDPASSGIELFQRLPDLSPQDCKTVMPEDEGANWVLPF